LVKGVKTYTIKYNAKTIKVSRGKYRFYNSKPKNPPKMSKRRHGRKSNSKRKRPIRSKSKRKSKRRSPRKSSKRRSKRSSKRRSKNVIPPLAKGTLGKYGYSAKISTVKRRAALAKAVKAYGRNTVIRKLNAVKTLQKNKNPKVSSIFSSDMKWIQGKYPGKNRG
jgi:hypothetical protein